MALPDPGPLKEIDRWSGESPASRWNDEVYGPPHSYDIAQYVVDLLDSPNEGSLDPETIASFQEYLKALKTEGATDAQMLDAYNDNLPLLKKMSGGYFPNVMRVNESKHMSTITNCYASAYTTNSDEAIGTALGKAIRHSRSVAMREHIKADRLERVNQFLVSIRRELGYIRSLCGTDAFSHATSLLESKHNWHDIGVPVSTHPKIDEWLAIAKRKSYTADAQSEIINADLEELERGLQAMRHQIDDMDRINREGEQVNDKLYAIFQ